MQVEGNEIKVYNKNSADEVLRITGDKLTKLPESKKTAIYIPIEYKVNGDILSSLLTSNVYKTSFYHKSITIPDDGYKYHIPNFTQSSLDITLYRESNGSTGTGINLYVAFDFCICKKNTPPNNLSYSGTPPFSSTNSSSNTFVFQIFDSSSQTSKSYTFTGTKALYWQGQYPLYSKDNGILAPGEYDIYSRIYLHAPGQYGSSWSQIKCQISPNIHINDAFYCENILPEPKAEISSYGFRYVVDDKKYASLTQEGTFLFRNGDCILAVDDDGIGMTFDGDVDNIKRIEPKKYKFRLDGSKNVQMTVLTFGDAIETTT